jgi:hypothetical protein
MEIWNKWSQKRTLTMDDIQDMLEGMAKEYTETEEDLGEARSRIDELESELEEGK